MNPAPGAKGADASPDHPHLQRRFGLLQATALNMTNMIGMGPFITIPLLMSALGGPQALLGWFLALIITIPDGLIWSELGAAMPGSGGSYVYLREGFGRNTWGRLMAFLFIWQFILSGPLEIASGYIGMAQYMKYVWPGMTRTQELGVCLVAGLAALALLYRRIQSIAWITVCLWIGTLLTVVIVIGSGMANFSAARAFDFPPDAFKFTTGFFLGLGAAARIGIYDYLGYYDVCYIGDEVREPGRTIPKSILLSLVGVALIYLLINLSVVGVIPWREFVPASDHPESNFIVSVFMEKIYGSKVASVFTALICWTAFGSVFALLLGYSRIPFAAALDGCFFRLFGVLHARKDFPHRSLLVVGVLSIVACALPLGTVIDALLTTRIVVQFMGQIGALVLLRRNRPDLARPYKMWLYPLPCFVALAGWLFLLATTDRSILVYGALSLIAGVVAYLIWAARQRAWPFAAAVTAGSRS
ncbi:MAG: amino acid permease [Verrucomicrobiales bacterium]|nr:amino acid permease [Verrucomicrobiales bacterium]